MNPTNSIGQCEVCRGRKSRCDGAKPKCRLCTELKAVCVYREPGTKLDAGDKLILERLSRIEGLLQSNIFTHTKSQHLAVDSPAYSSGTTLSPDDLVPRNQEGGEAVAAPRTRTSTPTNASLNPESYNTSALHLLRWPVIDNLVSRPYDPQSMLQLELSREPLQLGTLLSLDLSNTTAYVQAFFEQVNIWYACVNPYDWATYYRTALCYGFREGPESCLCLLVMALGNASLGSSISNIPPDKELPGIPYFSAAWGLIPGMVTRNTILSSQCLILASAYLFYLIRPLEAWTLLSSASTKLQLLLNRPGRIPRHLKELSQRVCWNALLFESDLLAEFDLPRSGIVHLESTLALPGGFEEDDQAQSAGRDEPSYFVAVIALYQLRKRVQQMTGPTGGAAIPIVGLILTLTELDYQLSQWYKELPVDLQFPYDQVPHAHPVQKVLRLRYFACRTAIFRPSILAVLENEAVFLDGMVQEQCHRCLEACIRQLEHLRSYQVGHVAYLWQGTLSILSQTVLLMGATLSPSLTTLLPPGPSMDAIIGDVLVEVERSAHLAPSLRFAVDMVREMEERRQVRLRQRG